MFRRTARNALQPTEVRYRIRYRKRNRSHGKWVRMLRKTLLFLRVCGRVRRWMRVRMRMCNTSRFRNNTHPLPLRIASPHINTHNHVPLLPPLPLPSHFPSSKAFKRLHTNDYYRRDLHTRRNNGFYVLLLVFCLFFPRYHLFMLTALRQHYTL